MPQCPWGMCSFHDGIKVRGDQTFKTGKPFGKSTIIKSNPSNLQTSEEM